jgi:hypothetical protein
VLCSQEWEWDKEWVELEILSSKWQHFYNNLWLSKGKPLAREVKMRMKIVIRRNVMLATISLRQQVTQKTCQWIIVSAVTSAKT